MNTNCRFSSDVAEIDRDQVHHWISGQSHWASGRSRSRQDAAVNGSRNFEVYDTVSNRQVAYARVITDGVTFAWLCDVFVDPAARDHGIGLELARYALDRATESGGKRAWLFSRRSGPFWQKVGFASADRNALALALASTHQVRLFPETGQLQREVAWSRLL